MGLSPDRIKPKTIKFVFVVSLQSTQQYRERANAGLIGIRVMCPSGATCLLSDCCYKNPTTRVGLAHSKPHHHLIDNYRHEIVEKLVLSNNYSLTHSISEKNLQY